MNRRSPTNTFHWDSPIIVIGTGRSGSTLLGLVLGAHPEVCHTGENNYLLNRLWEEFFALPEYVNIIRTTNLLSQTLAESNSDHWLPPYRMLTNRDQLAKHQELLDTIDAEEEVRLSSVLGRFVAESLVPPQIRVKFWSFKEIWNGSGQFPHGWRRHELAFPKARYLHIVRHPRPWLKTYLANSSTEPTEDNALFALGEWTRINSVALERQSQKGRYKEIRYESLIENPRAEIFEALSFLGLSQDDRCLEPLSERYNPRKREINLPKLSASDIHGIQGFEEMAERYGYDLRVFWDE